MGMGINFNNKYKYHHFHVVFVKKVSLTLCLNLLGFSSKLVHSFGKLFQIFAPIYEALFSPIFVNSKGSFN